MALHNNNEVNTFLMRRLD